MRLTLILINKRSGHALGNLLKLFRGANGLMHLPVRQLTLLSAIINHHARLAAPVPHPSPIPHTTRSTVALDDLAVFDMGADIRERRGW